MKLTVMTLKKAVSLLLCTGLLVQAGGCTKAEQATHEASSKPDMIEAIAQEKEAAAQDTSQEASTVETPAPVVTAPELKTPNVITGDAHLPALPESDVDMDLTKMGSTVIYARVLNMLTHPENYIGMSVRMKGTFSVYTDEETKENYFACFINDASACCAQGIEFVRKGEYAYPEDYPAEGEFIEVEGIVEIYEENGYKYVHLVDSDLHYTDSSGT